MKKLFNNRGYTLIELLVVLALMSIIAAIVIPRIDQDYGYVDNFTDDFTYDLRYLRESTMEGKTNCSVDVYYGSGNNGYYEVYIDGINIKTNYLKTGFNMTETNKSVADSTITFRADGILNSNALTIEISGDGQDNTVTINSVGGIFVD